MKPVCPRCNGALSSRIDYIGEGGSLGSVQTVFCLACGWSISQPNPDVVSLYRDIPLKQVKGYVADTRSKARERSPRIPFVRSTLCAVVSCSRLLGWKNRSGLCKICNNLRLNWEGGKRMTPPPFIPAPELPGRLITNPARSGAHWTTTKGVMPCSNAC